MKQIMKYNNDQNLSSRGICWFNVREDFKKLRELGYGNLSTDNIYYSAISSILRLKSLGLYDNRAIFIKSSISMNRLIVVVFTMKHYKVVPNCKTYNVDIAELESIRKKYEYA